MEGETPRRFTADQVCERLRTAFGADQQFGSLARWVLRSADGERKIDVWVDLGIAECPCDVWMIRPEDSAPTRCDVASAEHAQRLIDTLRTALGESLAPREVCAEARKPAKGKRRLFGPPRGHE